MHSNIKYKYKNLIVKLQIIYMYVSLSGSERVTYIMYPVYYTCIHVFYIW